MDYFKAAQLLRAGSSSVHLGSGLKYSGIRPLIQRYFCAVHGSVKKADLSKGY